MHIKYFTIISLCYICMNKIHFVLYLTLYIILSLIISPILILLSLFDLRRVFALRIHLHEDIAALISDNKSMIKILLISFLLRVMFLRTKRLKIYQLLFSVHNIGDKSGRIVIFREPWIQFFLDKNLKENYYLFCYSLRK